MAKFYIPYTYKNNDSSWDYESIELNMDKKNIEQIKRYIQEVKGIKDIVILGVFEQNDE